MAKKRGKRPLDRDYSSFISKLHSVNEFIQDLETSSGKPFPEIITLIQKTRQLKKNFFPITTLNKKLGATECLVRYLKDELGWNYKKISSILHRTEAVVGVMYRTSLKKFQGKLKPTPTTIFIPLSIFSQKFTIFESIILYLKDKEELRYSEIAKLTQRDQRTIWTIYNRAKRKRKNET